MRWIQVKIVKVQFLILAQRRVVVCSRKWKTTEVSTKVPGLSDIAQTDVCITSWMTRGRNLAFRLWCAAAYAAYAVGGPHRYDISDILVIDFEVTILTISIVLSC